MTSTPMASTTDPEATLLGGRYALGPAVGHGGMSTVYEAFDRVGRASVAVKVFHPGIELSDSLPRRRREVQLASALHHPGIVRILDADVEQSDRFGGRAYIVTELVHGPTLTERIRTEPLSPPQAARVGAVLCDALTYMHRQGIVHRDIKPANILLTGESAAGPLDPKLTDFGLARTVDSTRMTGVGLTAGTPNYLSPEQVRGLAGTPASDIYSLGLVLIETLTGRPAFAGHGIEVALARLTHNPSLPPNLDPRLASLLAAMTDAKPERRPTAADAGLTLRRLASGSLASDLVAFGPAPTLLAPAAGWRRFGLAAATLALLCAAAVGAVVIALGGLLGGSPGSASVLMPSASLTTRDPSPAAPASPRAVGSDSTSLVPAAPAAAPAVATPSAAPTVRAPGGKGRGADKSNNKP